MRSIIHVLRARPSLVVAALALLFAASFAPLPAVADPPLSAPSSLAGTAPSVGGSATDWHDMTGFGTASAYGTSGRVETGKLRVSTASGQIDFENTGLDKGTTAQTWSSPATTFAGKVASTARGSSVVETAEAKDSGFEDAVAIPSGWGNKKLVLHGKLTTALTLLDTFDGWASSGTFSTDGQVIFTNSSGVRCLSVSPASAVDNAGTVRSCDVAWTKVSDGYTFTITIPAAWMNTASYPVKVKQTLGVPEALSPEYANQDFESATAGGSGEYFVTWTSNPVGPGSEDVYGRLVAADGSALGGTFVIANGTKSQRYARVAYASGSGGVFGVAHKDGNKIVFRRFDTAGTLLSSVVVSDAADTDQVRTVDIASNGVDQFCIVFTGDLAAAANRQTWAAVRGADGSLIKADTLVGPAPGTLFHGQPTVIWNSVHSQWFFTWDEWDSAPTAPPHQVEGVAWNAGLTATVMAEFAIPTSAGSNFDARAAWDAGSNEYLVVWTNNPPTGPTNVLGQRVRGSDGVLLGTPFNVEGSTGRSKDTAIVRAINGHRWLVGFKLNGAGANGTYGQVLKSDGTLTGPLFVLSDDSDFAEAEVALSWNSVTDQFLATWTDGTATTQNIWSVRLDVTPPAAPGPVTTWNTSSVITLAWPKGTESDLATYEVYRTTVSGSGYVLKTSFAAPSTGPVSWTDTAVVANTRYYYVVRAIDTHANSSDNSTEASESIDTIPPGAPTGLAGTAGDSHVALTWSANPELDLAGYFAYYRISGVATWTRANSTLAAAPAFDVTGLTNATPYDFAVTAVDTDSNESALSASITRTPAGSGVPPAPPTGLLAVSGAGQVQMSWNPEPGVAGFNLYFKTPSASTWTKHNTALLTAPTDTVTGLPPFATYLFKATAVSAGGLESPDSVIVTAHAGVVPAAPAPVSVVATAGEHQVVLTWVAGTGDDTIGFDVFRSLTASGTFFRINGSPITAFTYTDTGLTNGTTYFYRIAAVQAAPGTDGNFSVIVSATPGYPRPTALTLTGHTGATASMSWTGVSDPGLTGYKVYRSTTSGSGYSPVTLSPISGLSFTNTGLTAGTYYWVVTANSATEESGYSNEITATLSGVEPPSPPNLDATNVRKTNARSPNISGTTSPSYLVKLYEGATFLGSGNAGTDGVFSFHMTAVLAEGEHIIQATAQASESDPVSGLSSGRVVTVDVTPPATPTGLAILAGDGWVNVQWDANTEPDLLGYNIYRRTTAPDDPWVKLNVKPLANPRYVDRTVSNGTTYQYRATAVDNTVIEE